MVAGLVVHLERHRNVLKHSQEYNRRRQADERPGPSLGRKCGKGGNVDTSRKKNQNSYFETSQNTLLQKGKQFLRFT